MSNKIFFKQNIIDIESGEILRKNNFLSSSRFDPEKGYCFIYPGQKAARTVMSGLPDGITDSEAGKLFKLLYCTNPNTNLLTFRSGNIYKAMQKEHIARLLGLSARSCSRFINKMMRLNILAKTEVIKNNVISDRGDFRLQCINKKREENYFFNPVYCFSGNWLGYNLYILFKNDLDKILPLWVVNKFNAEK